MKKKEIKKLAEEIASYERIIQTTQDPNEKSEAQNKVIRLSEKAETIDDMVALDICIQEILSN